MISQTWREELNKFLSEEYYKNVYDFIETQISLAREEGRQEERDNGARKQIWANAYQKRLSEAGSNDFEEYTQMQAKLYADEIVRQTNSISSL